MVSILYICVLLNYIIMKRFLSFLIAGCSVALISSCSSNLKTSTFERAQTTALADGSDASMTIVISYELPDRNREMSEEINEKVLGSKYGKMNQSDILDNYIDDRTAEYREANLPLLKMSQESGEPYASLNWEEYITGSFSPESHGTVSYTIERYVYTGGAHGMSSETAINFNRRTGEEIDEDDFFTDGSESQLSSLLTQKASEYMKNSGNGSLFVDKVEPNDNFRVSDEGVTYIYNPYEIAPYSSGIIKLTLKWPEIENILK